MVEPVSKLRVNRVGSAFCRAFAPTLWSAGSFGANATPLRSGQTRQVCPLPRRRGLASKKASRAATGSFEIGSAMTITEKILARAAHRDFVSPGDNIWVDADVLMTHDVCGPGTIGVFKREFGGDAKVWDTERVVIIPDHYIFTSDEKCRRNVDDLRKFVCEQGLRYFYDPGTESYSGVCHVTLPEKGHCRPGEVLFGTDSHTC
ncbi:MAG: hypothetical protein JW808_10015, partial [Victivallales bacterium]|nr:hypothetical protein [Victivallales bacterium]